MTRRPSVGANAAITRDTFQSAHRAWSQARRPSAAECLLVLTLVAATLRISHLDSKSLWLDEGFTAYRIRLPLMALVKSAAASEMNMYLYYVLMHVWILMAGASEFMLRLPSAIFATAAVPLVYALGAELRDRDTGLLGALFVAVNATCIQYAQTVRGYALLLMLSVLSALLFVKSVKRDSLRNCAAYVISGAAAVYVHLFAILAIPPQWLSLFIFRPGRRTIIRLTLAALLTGMLGGVAILISIYADVGQLGWVPATTATAVIQLCFIFAGVFDGLADPPAMALLALYLVGIAVAVVHSSRRDRAALGYMLLSAGFPIGLSLVVSIFKPLFVARYFLPSLPFFALLAAVGILQIKPRALAIGVVTLITILSLGEDRRYYKAAPTQDWRGAINFVATRGHPEDALVIYPDYYWVAPEYYISRLDQRAAFPSLIYEAPGSSQSFAASDGAPHRRIWFTFPTQDPIADQGVEDALRNAMAGRHATEDRRFPGVRLMLLELP
jgi:mannosyltransferase